MNGKQNTKVIMELELEYVSIESLKPYEKNARKHGRDDLQAIITSIQKFGFNDPIGVWHDVIVEGHGRWLAAKEIGMDRVPVIRLDQLSDEQRKAYALAHNKTAELSSWDFDVLATELKDISEFDMTQFGFDLSAIGGGGADPEAQEDNFQEEPPKKPKTRLGDLYRLGRHYLICGDSTKPETIKRLLQGQQADLLITDPPYNVALGYGMTPEEAKKRRRRTDGKTIENDEKTPEEFLEFLKQSFMAANENMKPGGAFYIWHADTEALNFREACKEIGWQVRQNLIWNKNTFALGRQDYQWKHEPCLYGWKDGAAHYFVDDRTQSTVFEDKDNDIDHMKKEEMRTLLKQLLEDKISTTVINEDKPARSAEHPTMKPIRLLARQIKNSSKPGENVLDIFGGSGSTLITCEQLGRNCYTAELDPGYCDVIIKRWEDFTGQQAEKIHDEAEVEKQDQKSLH